jgi:hypothetical protein
VTSVLVRADTVIPPARCGSGPGQLAKYTVVVSSDNATKVLAGQTYECFADALFANMLGTTFQLDIFVWSAAAYTAAQNPMNGALPIGSIETMLHAQCDANVPCQNGYLCFGTCVPTCDKCTPGFACDDTTKACTANPRVCTLTTDCTDTNVCVQARCVKPCGNNLPCDVNQICVAGGCLPDGGQPAAGLVALQKLTPTTRKQCQAVQTSNVQAVAQCTEVGPDGTGLPRTVDAGIDATMDSSTDASKDAPADATGN